MASRTLLRRRGAVRSPMGTCRGRGCGPVLAGDGEGPDACLLRRARSFPFGARWLAAFGTSEKRRNSVLRGTPLCPFPVDLRRVWGGQLNDALFANEGPGRRCLGRSD